MTKPDDGAGHLIVPCCIERSELQADVERLRAELAEEHAKYVGVLVNRDVHVRQENELRADAERAREYARECEQGWRQANAEIARLRAVVDIARDYAKSGMDARLSTALAALDKPADPSPAVPQHCD